MTNHRYTHHTESHLTRQPSVPEAINSRLNLTKAVLTLLLLLAVVPCQGRSFKIQYEDSDSLKVVSLLADARRQTAGTNYTIFFARRLKGIPYVGHTLEVNKTEQLVINLRQLDCTTYVENVVALTMCMKQKKYTFSDFCDNLCSLRYRGNSAPDYTKRLHYFTDWIEDNTRKGICREVQSPNPPFSAVQKINVYYMSANPDKYKMIREHPEYIPQIAASEKAINGRQYRFIPKTQAKDSPQLRAAVKDGDIIALTSAVGGLDIQHVGFAVWHSDGLHLLNASSLRRKTVEESMTIYNYLQKQRKMTGFRVIRLL